MAGFARRGVVFCDCCPRSLRVSGFAQTRRTLRKLACDHFGWSYSFWWGYHCPQCVGHDRQWRRPDSCVDLGRPRNLTGSWR